MHKMSGKYLEKKYKIRLKSIFLIPCIIFKVNFQLWVGLRNAILQYNTLSMMCILATGLKWRPQGETQNKERASVRLYWLSSPLTACRPPKYPVSASVQSTNSTKVFDALITRQPFWKRHSWQSLGFCLQPQRTCTWNLKLKFQSKLELRCQNHAIKKPKNLIWPPGSHLENEVTENQ